jgi:hypothetical protein
MPGDLKHHEGPQKTIGHYAVDHHAIEAELASRASAWVWNAYDALIATKNSSRFAVEPRRQLQSNICWSRE